MQNVGQKKVLVILIPANLFLIREKLFSLALALENKAYDRQQNVDCWL